MESATVTNRQSDAAFSIVESVMSIGLIGTVLMTLIALLANGLTIARTSASESEVLLVAQNIQTLLKSDLNVPPPEGEAILFFNQAGERMEMSTEAHMVARIQHIPTNQATPYLDRMTVKIMEVATGKELEYFSFARVRLQEGIPIPR